MRDLAAFRDAVRGYRRDVGRTQQQLARTIGLHPDVLSHKLNGRDHAVLTTTDVTGIVTTLAGWAALRTRAEAEQLLGLMDVPAHAVPATAWDAPPLSALSDGLVAPAAPVGPLAGPVGPPVAAPRIRPAAAPVPRTELIGRVAEREAIAAALNTSRLVTLVGVGGTGKTRLAVQLAHQLADRYPDGVAFADLAAVREPELLALALARVFGLDPPSAEDAEARVVDALQGQQVLLVCDNLEQLLDGTPLLGRLLAAAPQLQVLATSRIPLRLYGEHVLRVPPLGLPTDADPTGGEAIQLFRQRARAARSDFTGVGDELAVAAICAALDGLPLAIELAAATVRLYPPPALLDRLSDRFGVLAGGPRDLPHRQQTLRAALDWSYTLLDDTAQRLFACVGVFAGPFDSAAAAAVSGSNDAPALMLDRLDALSEQSLLELVPGPTPQFRLLQTVREYALARLAEAGDVDAARRRHLDHYLAVAVTAGGDVSGPRDRAALDTLEAAYPNIRAALDFVLSPGGEDRECLQAGLRLAIALVPLWQRRLSIAEGAWRFERLRALDADTEGPADLNIRAQAVLDHAALECFRGDYRRSITLAEQGRMLYEQLGDHRGLARAHRFLGEAVLAVGDIAGAAPHFRAQRAESVLADDTGGEASADNMLGQLARHRGEYAEATTLLRRALRLWNRADDPYSAACAMNSLGEVARDAGDADRARRRYRASLRRNQHLGHARSIAYDLEGLAAAAALDGDGRQALLYLGAAQTLREHNNGPLPPVEQRIVDRILSPAVDRLTTDERDAALARGRTQPLDDTIREALAG